MSSTLRFRFWLWLARFPFKGFYLSHTLSSFHIFSASFFIVKQLSLGPGSSLCKPYYPSLGWFQWEEAPFGLVASLAVIHQLYGSSSFHVVVGVLPIRHLAPLDGIWPRFEGQLWPCGSTSMLLLLLLQRRGTASQKNGYLIMNFGSLNLQLSHAHTSHWWSCAGALSHETHFTWDWMQRVKYCLHDPLTLFCTAHPLFLSFHLFLRTQSQCD